MSSQQDRTPLRRVLPRNLTARADYLVPGNPMIARPESGVGNAHPGLEFDVRSLDRHFLPGLVFDFQYGIGAKLVDLDTRRLADRHGLATADVAQKNLFLWAVQGRFGDEPDKVKTIRLLEVDGYMVLRRVRDLERGRVAVIVGRLPEAPEDGAKLDATIAALHAGVAMPSCERQGEALVWARVDGERAAYIDEDGVIDPELMPPGEITRNMCSPWQWDFAECYCYYWASSKPDIVIGISGDAQVLNFQRDRNAPEPARPARDWQSWRADSMTNPALILEWEKLPVVTAEREGTVPQTPTWPPLEPLMSLDEIATELQKLARLEHALCVEYLFAKYSIRAPRKAPHPLRRRALWRYRAAREVFNIAIDEMRHLRWVNEALRLLGNGPNLGRADEIGRDMCRPFELRPLTPKTLDEFIGIEEPSAVFNPNPQQIEGLYTRILVSLHHRASEGDPIPRLEQLIKVIIDEGESHWLQFRRVKELLAGDNPASYLRIRAPGKAEREPWQSVQKLCDDYYDLLLHALYITFGLDRLSRAFWLSVAHGAMVALDDMAFRLSKEGYGPRFCLPKWTSQSGPPLLRHPAEHRAGQGRWRLTDLFGDEQAIDKMLVQVFATLDGILAQASGRLRRLALAQRERMEKLRASIVREYRRDLAGVGSSPIAR